MSSRRSQRAPAAATAQRQQWIADLGVKQRLKEKTEDRAEIVRAIREAMGK